jgi:hypothetical protein
MSVGDGDRRGGGAAEGAASGRAAGINGGGALVRLRTTPNGWLAASSMRGSVRACVRVGAMDELMDDMETEVLPVQCHETCFVVRRKK